MWSWSSSSQVAIFFWLARYLSSSLCFTFKIHSGRLPRLQLTQAPSTTKAK
nr:MULTISPECIES: hypothetical protein [unclassified Apibacter]